MADHENRLRLRRLGIDTHQETVIYMRKDCHICRAEGFKAQARIWVTAGARSIIATLNQVTTDLLAPEEASLSEAGWARLGVSEGDEITIAHARHLDSMSDVRAKVYGNRLDGSAMQTIIRDVVSGRYSDIHLSAFVTACSSVGLNREEMVLLTRAMLSCGERLHWSQRPIVDKHSVGGLPGNRTTPIVVAIVAACGLIMPKTSSRAITSPAGTADAMETMAPVDLDMARLRSVVEREGGCIAWGGSVQLSPADDIFIRVERVLDIDSEGQLVASILSKKAAAGSTHLVIDMPVGPTAKVRSAGDAARLSAYLVEVGEAIGLSVQVVATDGLQPVGRGIGPALEAFDVMSVLQNAPDAPKELRRRAIALAAALLELGGAGRAGTGVAPAERTLDSGAAWRKFQAICDAQGGMRSPPVAAFHRPVTAYRSGWISAFDNRSLARVAKLAGAPDARAAGLVLHTRLGAEVQSGDPLFTIHAETPGELEYALNYVNGRRDIVTIGDGEED